MTKPQLYMVKLLSNKDWQERKNTRVNERTNLTEKTLNMDNIDNLYLTGDKSEEKL